MDFVEPVGFKGSKYDYSKQVEAGEAMGGANTSSATSTEGKQIQPRTLQKARQDDSDGNLVKDPAFKAFGGSANRIDGKQTSSEKAKQEHKDSKDEINAKRLAALGGSCGGATASTSVAVTSSVPERRSTIGNKYSKKKSAVSAFTGSGNKLG